MTTRTTIMNDADTTAMLETLADAFGGRSQLPDVVIGMAIRGRVENASLKNAPDVILSAALQVADYWEADRGEVIEKIREGFARL